MSRFYSFVSCILVVCALAGCGGSGGGATTDGTSFTPTAAQTTSTGLGSSNNSVATQPTASSTDVAGTVAMGDPQAGATITVKNGIGQVVGQTVSNKNGVYVLTVGQAVLNGDGPFIVRADLAGGRSLFSFTPGYSIANVTPASDAFLRAFYQALGTTPEAAFDTMSATTPVPNAVMLGNAVNDAVGPLAAAYNTPAGFDAMRTPFATANSPFDSMLDALKVKPVSGGFTLSVASGNGGASVNVAVSRQDGVTNHGFQGTSIIFRTSGTSTSSSGVSTALDATQNVVNALVAASNVDATSPRADVPAGPVANPNSDKKLVAYYASWSVYRAYKQPNHEQSDTQKGYWLRVNPNNRADTYNVVPADKLDVLCYAFIFPKDDGSLVIPDWVDKDRDIDGGEPGLDFKGNFLELVRLKRKYPVLKTCVSIGGALNSAPFATIAASDALRKKFAANIAAFVKHYQFDGVDIDWEFPSASDKTNCTLLFTEIRNALGKGYLLTAAVSAGPDHYNNMELKKVADQLDWYNLMAYDFHATFDGPSSLTGLHAPLFKGSSSGVPDPFSPDFNVHGAVSGYINAGVSEQKIVLGIPAYGQGYGNVQYGNHGLFQHWSSVPAGTYAAGSFDYWHIYYYLANPKYPVVFYDNVAVEAYFFGTIYTQPGQNGIFISYDDANPDTGTVVNKVAYARKDLKGLLAPGYDLRGLMVWELDGDIHDANQGGSIIGTIARKK